PAAGSGRSGSGGDPHGRGARLRLASGPRGRDDPCTGEDREENPAAGDRRLGLRHRRGSAGTRAAGSDAARRRRAARREQRARGVLPGLQPKMILHAGPPIAWGRMCGPMRGAIVGAILYEGWAQDAARAEAMAAGGDIAFAPCHHHAAVGPMSGIISPSMPVWIVRNAQSGNVAFSNMNEGLGKVLRFGANGPEVIERLHWMRQVLAPALQAGLKVLGPLELKPLIAQALHM